jgi:hypothetical protein
MGKAYLRVRCQEVNLHPLMTPNVAGVRYAMERKWKNSVCNAEVAEGELFMRKFSGIRNEGLRATPSVNSCDG